MNTMYYYEDELSAYEPRFHRRTDCPHSFAIPRLVTEVNERICRLQAELRNAPLSQVFYTEESKNEEDAITGEAHNDSAAVVSPSQGQIPHVDAEAEAAFAEARLREAHVWYLPFEDEEDNGAAVISAQYEFQRQDIATPIHESTPQHELVSIVMLEASEAFDRFDRYLEDMAEGNDSAPQEVTVLRGAVRAMLAELHRRLDDHQQEQERVAQDSGMHSVLASATAVVTLPATTIQDLADCTEGRGPGPREVPDCLICQLPLNAYTPTITHHACSNTWCSACLLHWADTCRRGGNRPTCPTDRQHIFLGRLLTIRRGWAIDVRDGYAMVALINEEVSMSEDEVEDEAEAGDEDEIEEEDDDDEDEHSETGSEDESEIDEEQSKSDIEDEADGEEQFDSSSDDDDDDNSNDDSLSPTAATADAGYVFDWAYVMRLTSSDFPPPSRRPSQAERARAVGLVSTALNVHHDWLLRSAIRLGKASLVSRTAPPNTSRTVIGAEAWGTLRYILLRDALNYVVTSAGPPSTVWWPRALFVATESSEGHALRTTITPRFAATNDRLLAHAILSPTRDPIERQCTIGIGSSPGGETTCPICQQEIGADTTTITHNLCRTTFCIDCLHKWADTLSGPVTCPMDRRHIDIGPRPMTAMADHRAPHLVVPWDTRINSPRPYTPAGVVAFFFNLLINAAVFGVDASLSLADALWPALSA